MNHKFLVQVQATQVTRQISQLYKNCNNLFNKIKTEVISRKDIEKVIDREMAMIEKANEKQAKIQAQLLDDMFTDFERIVTESFGEMIKGKKGLAAMDANAFQQEMVSCLGYVNEKLRRLA